MSKLCKEKQTCKNFKTLSQQHINIQAFIINLSSHELKQLFNDQSLQRSMSVMEQTCLKKLLSPYEHAKAKSTNLCSTTVYIIMTCMSVNFPINIYLTDVPGVTLMMFQGDVTASPSLTTRMMFSHEHFSQADHCKH